MMSEDREEDESLEEKLNREVWEYACALALEAHYPMEMIERAMGHTISRLRRRRSGDPLAGN